jgi:hypothetical protein
MGALSCAFTSHADGTAETCEVCGEPPTSAAHRAFATPGKRVSTFDGVLTGTFGWEYAVIASARDDAR